jgi:CBS domain containing-hemolysin-like protein
MLDDYHSIIIAAGFVSFLLAAVSASTAAVSYLRLGVLKKKSRENDKRAIKVLDLIEEDREKILLGLWMIHSVLSIFIGALVVIWTLYAFPGVHYRFYYAIIITTTLIVLFGEVLPRSMAAINPEVFTVILFPLIRPVAIVTVPIANILIWIFSPILSRIQPKEEESLKLAEEEIRRIVEEGQEMGVLEEEETRMIHSIFDFGDTIAKEVMIPRVDMICADKKATILDLMKIITDSGFSRIPIFEGSVDRILGIVYAKDLLSHISCDNFLAPAVDVARKPPFFVPGTKNLDELLKEMKKKSISIAIVVDEYGGTDGMVTVEDILEEIVGDITDEHDRETPWVTKIDDVTYRVDGRSIIEDVNAELDINLPAEEQETVGGYVYGVMGHIPVQGEKITIEDLGIEIVVEKTRRQRIESLIIKKLSGGDS